MSFIVNSLLEQIKKRRIALAFKQHDMLLRVGMSRQQYQRLESKGNPRLDTLDEVILHWLTRLESGVFETVFNSREVWREAFTSSECHACS